MGSVRKKGHSPWQFLAIQAPTVGVAFPVEFWGGIESCVATLKVDQPMSNPDMDGTFNMIAILRSRVCIEDLHFEASFLIQKNPPPKLTKIYLPLTTFRSF